MSDKATELASALSEVEAQLRSGTAGINALQDDLEHTKKLLQQVRLQAPLLLLVFFAFTVASFHECDLQ